MKVLLKLIGLSLLLSFAFFGTAIRTAIRVEGTIKSTSYVSYAARTPSHAWEGRAPVKGLSLSFNPDAPNEKLDLEIVLDAGSFNSGNFARDINARRTVFETEHYPEIIFTGKRLSAATNLREDGDYVLELSGALNLHGVTRDLSTNLTLTKEGTNLAASGSFDVLLSDFAMKRPSLFGSLVEDKVAISYFVETVLEAPEP